MNAPSELSVLVLLPPAEPTNEIIYTKIRLNSKTFNMYIVRCTQNSASTGWTCPVLVLSMKCWMCYVCVGVDAQKRIFCFLTKVSPMKEAQPKIVSNVSHNSSLQVRVTQKEDFHSVSAGRGRGTVIGDSGGCRHCCTGYAASW